MWFLHMLSCAFAQGILELTIFSNPWVFVGSFIFAKMLLNACMEVQVFENLVIYKSCVLRQHKTNVGRFSLFCENHLFQL